MTRSAGGDDGVTQSAYKRYMLGVLLSILAFNYVDRLVLGLVLQDIKVDLQLSDTQLGVLSGIAFALFYSIFGVPIARWADRGNRVVIITVTTALWTVAVALCGVAGSFLSLLLIRIGVAVGEAGCIPPAHSLIADYFTRAERPRAVAIYMLGVPLSSILGYFVAGWLNEFYGWRVTFMLLSAPGLALALLAWFTLKEPRLQLPVRRAPQHSSGMMRGLGSSAALPQSSFSEVCAVLWANTTFKHVLVCQSVVIFFSAGIWKWQPAFFIRSHGLQTGELGTWFAVIYGLGGFLGTYLGGEWASRWAANNERLQLKVIAVGYSLFGVISALTYIAPSYQLAFALIGLASIGVAMTTGPLFATIQTLVPQRIRALSIAIIYLFANLIGLGLGPLAAGILSDTLRPLFGEQSLRYALLVLCPGYFWAAWHLWVASRTVTRDLLAAQEEEADPARKSPSLAPVAAHGELPGTVAKGTL